jgi:hypothetical protein
MFQFERAAYELIELRGCQLDLAGHIGAVFIVNLPLSTADFGEDIRFLSVVEEKEKVMIPTPLATLSESLFLQRVFYVLRSLWQVLGSVFDRFYKT